MSRAVALEDMFSHLLKIGLRHPSCPTFRLMATIHALRVNGEDEVKAMDASSKYELIRYLKDTFRNRAKLEQSPSEIILKLPVQASMFVEDFPDVAGTMYIDEPPVSCPRYVESYLQRSSPCKIRGSACSLRRTT